MGKILPPAAFRASRSDTYAPGAFKNGRFFLVETPVIRGILAYGDQQTVQKTRFGRDADGPCPESLIGRPGV